MDEVYASLAYDGAQLLRVPVCVSRALLVPATERTADRSNAAKGFGECRPFPKKALWALPARSKRSCCKCIWGLILW